MSLVTYQVDPKIVADVRTCIYIVITRVIKFLIFGSFCPFLKCHTTRWLDSVYLVSGIVPDGLLLWNGDAAHPYSRVLLADPMLISIWRSKWSTPCLLVIFTGCDSHFVLILWEYKSKNEKYDLEIQNNNQYTLCDAISLYNCIWVPFHIWECWSLRVWSLSSKWIIKLRIVAISAILGIHHVQHHLDILSFHKAFDISDF